MVTAFSPAIVTGLTVLLCVPQVAVASLFVHSAWDHHRLVNERQHGNRQQHDFSKGLNSLQFKSANVISNNFGGLGPKKK